MQLPRATRLVVRIAGERMYLWRAVDHEGEVLDMLLQRRRDSRAALRLMRNNRQWAARAEARSRARS
jgi:putative transposase